MPTLRNLLKSWADSLGLVDAVLRARSGRKLVFAYHNVCPAPVPDDLGSMHLSLSTFEAQVTWIADHFEVTDLRSLLAGDAATARPLAAFTFDDAYRGTVRYALPHLVERGIPATLFVSPGLLGGGAFWWDRFDLDGWSQREQVFGRLRGEDHRIAEWALARGVREREVPPDCRPASVEELDRLIREAKGLVKLGPHGWAHENMAALDRPALADRVERTRAWLEDRFPEAAEPIVAYPYGLWAPELSEMLPGLGLEAGLIIDDGWMPRNAVDPFRIPRRNVPAGAEGAAFRTMVIR